MNFLLKERKKRGIIINCEDFGQGVVTMSFMIDVFFGIPTDDLIPMSKKAGFDGFFVGQEMANFEDQVRELRAMADKEGLEIETIHSTIPGCYDLWTEGTAGEDYVAVLKNNIDNCKKFSIPILVVHIQVKEDGENLLERGIARLETVVAYAKEQGVKIAFENINEPEFLFEVMKHFQESHVGFCYDCGHEACHTPGVEFLPILGERLFCTHLHDNDGVGDLHLLPFDGVLDFERICRQLKEVNYQGNITLELCYSRDYQGKMSKTEFLERAYQCACRIKEGINR